MWLDERVAAMLGSGSETEAHSYVGDLIFECLIIVWMLAPCLGIERQLNVLFHLFEAEELNVESECFELNFFHRMGWGEG